MILSLWTPGNGFGWKKESVGVLLLLSHRLRLLALPFRNRTATQKPTRMYANYAWAIVFLKTISRHRNIAYPRASIAALSLISEEILREFQSVKNKRQYTLSIITCLHPDPQTPDRGLCETVCGCKIISFWLSCKIFQ